MNDSDEDVDPLMGPVADLMVEHNLFSTPAASTEEKPNEPMEKLDERMKVFDHVSFLNVHVLLKSSLNYFLDKQWYTLMKQHFPSIEQELSSSHFELRPSLTNVSLFILIYAILFAVCPLLIHLLLIGYLVSMLIVYFLLPLCIYWTWFQCYKTLDLFLNTVELLQQWLLNIQGFQLIRPTSTLFESQLNELRHEMFDELKRHFLYTRQLSQKYSTRSEQLICHIDLQEFTALFDPTTNQCDQMLINSLFKLCHLQINESIQLINMTRPKSYCLFYNYKNRLRKSIENLTTAKQSCGITMEDSIGYKKTSSKKLTTAYFLLRSNCDQLFDMNEKDCLNNEQLKKMIQDLKTVVYMLEGVQVTPKQQLINEDRTEEQTIDEINASNISSYHRFDDEIKESVDEVLVCDTGNSNDNETQEKTIDHNDYEERILREQTNCLMKELQVAIQGKKQEWNEREQRLLGNLENLSQEIHEEKTKCIVNEEKTFDKLPPSTNTISMLDELKHTFVLNKKKLNIQEDVFGEDDEESFQDDDE